MSCNKTKMISNCAPFHSHNATPPVADGETIGTYCRATSASQLQYVIHFRCNDSITSVSRCFRLQNAVVMYSECNDTGSLLPSYLSLSYTLPLLYTIIHDMLPQKSNCSRQTISPIMFTVFYRRAPHANHDPCRVQCVKYSNL